MTLRQLIQEIIQLDAFDELSKEIIKIHPDWSDKTPGDVFKVYKRGAEEIEDLPGDDELIEHTIIIDNIENTLSNVTESWMDIYLLDEDGDKWSMDMTDWNGLVDLEISDNICTTLTERLAKILYEITFWGTSRQAVINESKQLAEMTKNKDNLIEVTMEEFIAECDSLK